MFACPIIGAYEVWYPLKSSWDQRNYFFDHVSKLCIDWWIEQSQFSVNSLIQYLQWVRSKDNLIVKVVKKIRERVGCLTQRWVILISILLTLYASPCLWFFQFLNNKYWLKYWPILPPIADFGFQTVPILLCSFRWALERLYKTSSDSCCLLLGMTGLTGPVKKRRPVSRDNLVSLTQPWCPCTMSFCLFGCWSTVLHGSVFIQALVYRRWRNLWSPLTALCVKHFSVTEQFHSSCVVGFKQFLQLSRRRCSVCVGCQGRRCNPFGPGSVKSDSCVCSPACSRWAHVSDKDVLCLPSCWETHHLQTCKAKRKVS